ncbi:reverse transcriptase domain-containing protein, partial [Microcoleus sp. F4-D5]|uniref:reverse transcriptase domain-containing protein n=1 Tax=Microcoleus sp. F4-D5 TaxID=2818760 RepID=UPI002FD56580
MQPILAVNVTQRTTNWRSVNWRQANKVVRQLRQRIFRATQEGKWKKVRSLQKLLMRSYSNMLVSVRRVTQTNQGKNTPGVDKLVVKTPEARGMLVDILNKYIPWKPLPTLRVYIPKSNGKQRPLGIPCLIDRCLQAVVKNALEPAWEAVFEGSSYGFRPGRSAHDAIGKSYLIGCPHRKKKWVVDADIKGCFDNIDHDFLMKAIGNFPARKLIHQWLKSGYMENGAFYDTMTGTPQGGIVSPLLANIALHGMEEALG